MLELENVFRSQGLGRPAGRLDQAFVQVQQQRLHALLPQRLPGLVEHVFRRRFQGMLDDARRQLDPRNLGSFAQLVHRERQAPGAVSSLVTAQGIAGAGKRPVRVHLAKNVVFIGADKVDRQRWNDTAAATIPAFPVHAKGHVPEVRDKTDRRQRLATGGDFQRPFQHTPHRFLFRRQHPLPPQPLQQIPACLRRVAQFECLHLPCPSCPIALFIVADAANPAQRPAHRGFSPQSAQTEKRSRSRQFPSEE